MSRNGGRIITPGEQARSAELFRLGSQVEALASVRLGAPDSGNQFPSCGGCGRRAESREELTSEWVNLWGVLGVDRRAFGLVAFACSARCFVVAFLLADTDGWPAGVRAMARRRAGEASVRPEEP